MAAPIQLPGYEIGSQIGRGAGATISLAYERLTRRPVAIKHVVARSPQDMRFIAQAETEFRVSSQLDHPYLRKCYDIVRVRRWLRTRELFLVMEHVDGVRLEDRCPEHLDEIVSVFIQVAEGLHAMHLAGFAHADIKPNNILVTGDGGLKIIDFGQSCPLGHRKSRLQGTPDFMAPEQVERRAIDHRTDIFNFGASLYWVVTGKWFRTMISTAPTASRVIEIESRRGSEPPHELNPLIPISLSKLIMECCETNPEVRPPDMRKVASRLDVVLHLLDRRARETVIRRAAAN
ncbi:MAG: serine/threonine-protein kinase [Phycisphaerae bacterium]|jgi:serine/threonine-protein kinase